MPSVIKQESDTFIDIAHLFSTDWTMYDTHFHDHLELNLSISGGNRFFINDTIHVAEVGDLFILNTNDLHKNMVPIDRKYERYLINFSPDAIEPLCNSQVDLLELFKLDRATFDNKIALSNEDLLELTRLLDDTIYHSKSVYYKNDTYLQIKLAEVLLTINRIFHRSKKTDVTTEGSKYHKTQEIIDYLNHHLTEDLSLDFLSSQFYMNRTYLCDKFKADTGFTINQYITSQRILKARTLLVEGLSVTEVAQSVGYDNDSHFIRVFKKLIGSTPKQYALSKKKQF